MNIHIYKKSEIIIEFESFIVSSQSCTWPILAIGSHLSRQRSVRCVASQPAPIRNPPDSSCFMLATCTRSSPLSSLITRSVSTAFAFSPHDVILLRLLLLLLLLLLLAQRAQLQAGSGQDKEAWEEFLREQQRLKDQVDEEHAKAVGRLSTQYSEMKKDLEKIAPF